MPVPPNFYVFRKQAAQSFLSVQTLFVRVSQNLQQAPGWCSDVNRTFVRGAAGFIAGCLTYLLATLVMGSVLPLWWGIPLLGLAVCCGATAGWKYAGPLIAAGVAFFALDFAHNMNTDTFFYAFIAAVVTGLVCLADEHVFWR